MTEQKPVVSKDTAPQAAGTERERQIEERLRILKRVDSFGMFQRAIVDDISHLLSVLREVRGQVEAIRGRCSESVPPEDAG